MAEADVDAIRTAFRDRRYRLTAHAESEREADAIKVKELEFAFGSANIELLEDYPDDPRGHSLLVLGFNELNEPLHAVVGIASPDRVVVVTLYRPDPGLWQDWRRRAKR